MNFRSAPSSPAPAVPILNEQEFRELAALDTCSVANAIERFNVRLRNEGYTEGGLYCRFPKLPPMLGYAFPLQVRSGEPPSRGRSYFESTLWWDALLSVPAPRILVVQDMDRHPGAGALIGELHARILQKLGCIGVVTNGAVRELPRVEPLGFAMYSGTLSVSHSYSHVVRSGGRVQLGGLEVSTGDLLHGDCHGIVRIPPELAGRLAQTVTALQEKERQVVAYLDSPGFTVEGLRSHLES